MVCTFAVIRIRASGSLEDSSNFQIIPWFVNDGIDDQKPIHRFRKILSEYLEKAAHPTDLNHT